MADIKREVDHYEKVRQELKRASGDYVDLKMFEPAMRQLLDTYIRAEESEKLSASAERKALHQGHAHHGLRRPAVTSPPQ